MRLSLKKGKVLVVTAVELERDAIKAGIGEAHHVDVLVAGVGPVVSAAKTMCALTKQQYDLVVNMGIGGGFRGKTEIGAIVVASKIIAADFGVETPAGFSFADEFQLGSSKVLVTDEWRVQLISAFQEAELKVVSGPILTVSTVTGTEATAMELQQRVPDAAAEAMEGFGVAMAASLMKIPVLEVRAVSNMVGQRDKSKWRFDKAFKSLTKASQKMMEVLR